MTQLRARCKCWVSNVLDEIERGIGLRGSSFMDLDAVSHDAATHRFLVRELKRPNEGLDPAARITLCDIAMELRWTVWYLNLWTSDEIMWADMRYMDAIQVLTPDEYRERLKAWWQNRYRLENYVSLDQELPRRRA